MHFTNNNAELPTVISFSVFLCVIKQFWLDYDLSDIVATYHIYNVCFPGRQLTTKAVHMNDLLLHPSRGAEYCNQFVCLSVRLSASMCLEPVDRSSLFFCADPLWQWLGPPLAALHYVMYLGFSGIFMDDVTFWPQWAIWRFVASDVAIPGQSLMSVNAFLLL